VQLPLVHAATLRDCGSRLGVERADALARAGRIDFANQPPDFIDAGPTQSFAVKRRARRQQLVEQHAQGIHVAPRIDIQRVHLGLFRAHVERRADHLVECRVNRLLRQSRTGRLGDPKVDHLGHRNVVVQCDQNVRRLDVAVDDPFLMRVLNRPADLGKKLQPAPGIEPPLVAELRNRNAAHQLHDEVGASAFGHIRVEHFGDIRVVHQGQGLPLGLEAGQHLAGIHAGLDNFQRDLAADRFFLFGDVNVAHAALAQQLSKLIGTD
jgi:hypothetical protein